MALTSRQRRILAEADMSRRDFLKITGQAAAGAAAPQSILKGLMGPVSVSNIPKNPIEMQAALLKWAHDSGNYKTWYNACVKWYQNHTPSDRNPSGSGSPTTTARPREQVHKDAIKQIDRWATHNAQSTTDDFWDTQPPFRQQGERSGHFGWEEAMQWALDDNSTEPGDQNKFPEWVTQYRLSQWFGRAVKPDHPFVKNRSKWLENIFDIGHGLNDRYNKAGLEKFTGELVNVLKDSMIPERFNIVSSQIKDYVSEVSNYKTSPDTYEETDEDYVDDDPEIEEPEEKEPQEEPPQLPSDEPDSWRTQSVEFENRIRRLVR